MTAKIIPFNPLDKRNLGASVAEAMLTRPVHPLGSLPNFSGAGIYALYYTGSLEPYKRIAEANADGRFAAPIYVGKAVPEGARKGGGAQADPDAITQSLRKRLREHAKSIKDVSSLNVDDFHCRYLVVEDIWIPLGESLLIANFSPVWNSLVDGFGNHTPGKERKNTICPRWDWLHPGRKWAFECKPRSETPEQVARDVETYLRGVTFHADPRLITSGGGQP